LVYTTKLRSDLLKSLNDRFWDVSEKEFWKANHAKFPLLANLAKKYLGIPASSASVERMFSICGHILSLRRRKMGIKIFGEIVFLKLNEMFL